MGTGESPAGNHDYTTTYSTCGTIPLRLCYWLRMRAPETPLVFRPRLFPSTNGSGNKYAEGSGKIPPGDVRPCPELPTPNRKPPFQRRTPDRNSRRFSRMNGSVHPTWIILSPYILTLDAGTYSAELQPVKLATAK